MPIIHLKVHEHLVKYLENFKQLSVQWFINEKIENSGLISLNRDFK